MGVNPHAFLDQKLPTSIYDILGLDEQINGHFTGQHINSHFSSWSAHVEVSLYFSRLDEHAQIAVIDSALRENHVRFYKVRGFRTAELGSKVSDTKYMAYGPISGVAYHSVPTADVQSLMAKAPSWEAHLTVADIAWAKTVAARFRPKGDTRPDLIIGLTAIFLGLAKRRLCPTTKATSTEFQADVAKFMEGLSEELQAYDLPDIRGGNCSLANPHTDTVGYE